MKGYDAWKTTPPDEPGEIELPLCYLSDEVVRRALREALCNDPPHEHIPRFCGDYRSARELMETLLERAYDQPTVLLSPEEVGDYQASMASAAADRAHHQDRRERP